MEKCALASKLLQVASKDKFIDKSTTIEEREMSEKAIQVTVAELDEMSPQPSQEVNDRISELVEEKESHLLVVNTIESNPSRVEEEQVAPQPEEE